MVDYDFFAKEHIVFCNHRMKNSINSDLIRGNIDTIILKALAEGDRYGFDIVKEIEQKSSGQYLIKQPTLYSCLKRLETKGFIRSYWGAKTIGGRRKYYTLTDLGKELFTQYQTEWEYSRTVIDKLISDREYDLSRLGELADLPSEPSIETVDLESNSDNENIFDEKSEQLTAEDSDDGDSDSNDGLAVQTDEQLTEETSSDSDTVSTPTTFVCPYHRAQNEEYEALKEFYNETISSADSEAIDENLFSDEEAAKKLATNNDLNDLGKDTDLNNNTDSDHIDTAAIFDELLTIDGAGNSYTDNLNAQSYIATAQKVPPTFTESPIEFKYNTQMEIIDDTLQDDEENDFLEEPPIYNPPPATEPTAPPSQSAPSSFISYHTRPDTVAIDQDKLLLEKEYKNALTRLVSDQQTGVAEAAPAQTESAVIPLTKEMEYNNQLLATHYGQSTVVSTVTTTTETTNLTATEGDEFDRLSLSMRDLGDDITIRRHDLQESKDHTQEDYYYSNRLMLVHYGIMFAIMIAFIVTTFLISFVGLQTTGPARWPSFDIFMYVVAVLIAITPPIVAVILSFRNPDKQKRIKYSFKNALKYRLVLFVNILVITYLVNVYLGMNLSFTNGLDHLASLLLPALLALSLPISSLVFYGLYKTGRYAVK